MKRAQKWKPQKRLQVDLRLRHNLLTLIRHGLKRVRPEPLKTLLLLPVAVAALVLVVLAVWVAALLVLRRTMKRQSLTP
jgi:hypothetical protein